MNLKALVAIVVAGIMVMSVPMIAMAETISESGTYNRNIDGGSVCAVDVRTAEKNIVINGDTKNNSASCCTAYVIAKSEVTVNGNVNNEGNCEAINASGDAMVNANNATNDNNYPTVRVNNATVTVNDVVKNSGSGIAIEATNGATVTAGSAINTSDSEATVEAIGITTTDPTKQTKVEVKSAVTNGGTYCAIKASEGAIVTADSATNTGGEPTVQADGANTTVTVNGEVTNNGTGSGIWAKNGANVTAESVKTVGIGDAAAITVNNADTAVVVTGNVDSNLYCVMSHDGATVVIEGTATGVQGGVATDETGEVLVYEVKSGDPSKLASGNVHYIIKTLGSTDAIQLQSGYQTSEEILGKTYNYADASDTIIFSLKEGYNLNAPLATKNADGTYTIIVPAGGGVSIEAIMKAIQSKGGSYTSLPTSQGSSSAPITSGSWAQASNGKFTYTNNGEKLINCTAWIQYTDASGEVVTGKFCFDNNGYMIANTWKEVQSGVWNYFGADGKMVVNTTTPDGYVVDANGEWRK